MDSSSDLSDLALMRRSQAGDAECFSELMRRYRPALLRVARGRLQRPDWAEDVVQETFLAAYKSRHTYRDEFSLRTWLWTILLNQCRAHFGRQSRTPRVLSWTDEPGAHSQSHDAESGGLSPWEQLVCREQTERLESLLARLNAAQADALRLRFYGGLKFQEIADAMDCSLGTAKNRVRWGLLQLSKWLNERRAESVNPAAKPVDE